MGNVLSLLFLKEKFSGCKLIKVLCSYGVHVYLGYDICQGASVDISVAMLFEKNEAILSLPVLLPENAARI